LHPGEDGGGSRGRWRAGSGKSSNDPGAAPPPAAAENCAPPTSRSRARQSRVPSRSLQSSRPAATGSTARARGSAVPSPARRTWRTDLPQTDRSRRRPAAHSAACRTDAPAISAALRSRPTSTLAHSVGFPSPCATVYCSQSMLAILPIVTDFHHGLLTPSPEVEGEPENGTTASVSRSLASLL